MKNIVITPSLNTRVWSDFLDYYQIPYKFDNLWSEEKSTVCVPDSTVDTLIITEYQWLEQFFRYHKEELAQVLATNKILIVFQQDSPAMFMYSLKPWTNALDRVENSSNITFVVESGFVKHGLNNISVITDPWSNFLPVVESRLALKYKKHITKDFLVMFGREDDCRTIMWDKLNENKLLDNSHAVYHKISPVLSDNNVPIGVTQGFLGEDSLPDYKWKALIPPPDLYSSCAVEIVCETLSHFQSISWFTEKTIRPIAAKTAFLLFDAPGSLHELRKLGFKTFSSLIDESYDQETDLYARADKIIEVCKHIKDNGAEQFSQSAYSILEHNWNRLNEIKGKFLPDKDVKFFRILQTLGVKT